jgi:DoxX-like family
MHAITIQPKAIWTGRILSGLALLFLAFDTTMKLLVLPVAVQGTAQLGYSPSVIFPLGVIELVMLVLYAVPRTAILGAVLWTGYLGGAVATHVQHGDPWATHILSPIYMAAFLWGGLWLRDARLRSVFDR